MKRTDLNNLILEAYAEVISELNEAPNNVHYIKVESTELMEALGILEEAFADSSVKFELNDPDTIYIHNADNADMHDAVEELKQNGIIIDETSIDGEIEENQNWKQVGDTVYVKNVFGDEPKQKPKYDPKKGLTDLQKFVFKYELEISDEESAKKHLGDIQQLNTPDDVYSYYADDRGWEGEMDSDLNNIYKQVKKRFFKLNESLLDEVEEEDPTPEEDPDPKAGPETVLEDVTDTILAKFPTLGQAIIKLQTEDFKEFVDSIDWISPRPTSFRVNLKNGQDYILKWTGKTFEAQIMGKRYLLSNISDYQQAVDKLAILYRESPMKGAGEDEPA